MIEPWFLWLCRLYILDDVDFIEQDMEQLRIMFLAVQLVHSGLR